MTENLRDRISWSQGHGFGTEQHRVRGGQTRGSTSVPRQALLARVWVGAKEDVCLGKPKKLGYFIST